MASNDSAASVGGLGGSSTPWVSPKAGSGLGTGAPSSAPPFPGPTSQGGHSTGVGGLFAEWPGAFRPLWTSGFKGIFGGSGDRGGSTPR